jgi:preprotein translocase subunit YajC
MGKARSGFFRLGLQRGAVSNRKQAAVGFGDAAGRDYFLVSSPCKPKPSFQARAKEGSGLGTFPGDKCKHQAPAETPGTPVPRAGYWLSPKASEGRERSMNVATGFALWAGPIPGAGNGFSLLLPILLLIPLMYLLMIRPQQKRQKQWQEMLGGIKSGDRVTTAGGIRGIIISIKDDSIVIRAAPDNLKLEIAKTAIASVTTQEGSQTT